MTWRGPKGDTPPGEEDGASSRLAVARFALGRNAVATIAALLCVVSVSAGPALGATFTWTGEGNTETEGAFGSSWSNAENWGGTAPSSGSTLVFPELRGCRLPEACYQSVDNGLSVSGMTIGGYYNFPEGTGTGNPVQVGSGGISDTSTAGPAEIGFPITLTAPQTWSVAGIGAISLFRAVGGREGLTVHAANEGHIHLISGGFEVGPVFVTGANSNLSGSAAAGNGGLVASENVNAGNNEPTTVSHAVLDLGGFAYPPIAVSGGFLEVGGVPDQPAGVSGSIELSGESAFSGEYLGATGAVKLASASFTPPAPSCEQLRVGETRSLILGEGGLTGTFTNLANGQVLESHCSFSSEGQPPEGRLAPITARYDYTSTGLTETLLSVGGPPHGGALTAGELAGGGNNPSEFCVKCYIAKRLSFAQPVDVPTGNFWHEFTDFSIPGRGIPLHLSRTYNSGQASTTGPFGYGWSSSYTTALAFPDPAHVVVEQANGSQVQFEEQSGGTYRAPPRVTASLVHNSDGTWTLVRRHSETLDFDSSGRLTKEVDRNGYVTALAYSASGQLESVADSAGRKLTFSYEGNHVSSVSDPLGRITHYRYDEAGDLTDVIDVAGGDTHFTYDGSHRMLTMRTPDQASGVPGSTEAVVTNAYDSRGRVTEQTDQLGRTTKFAYSGEPLGEEGGSTAITDPKGNVIVQRYKFGELLSETRGYGTSQEATWSFEYDPATLGVTKITDPNGHSTTATFDGEGNTLTTTDALGRTTTDTYNAFNEPLSEKDPLGVTTTRVYDEHGNLLTVERPDTQEKTVQKTTYTYGDAAHPGDVTAMTTPEKKVWAYAYDTYGDRTSTTDPLKDKSTSTYNMIGWLETSVSPRGNAKGAKPELFTTHYNHNQFGQVTETTDPLGHKTTNEYDPDQNLTASTDGNGNTTRYTYDAADEQTEVHRADGTTLRTTYWPDGIVKEQIDGAGHATTYEYDALKRRVATIDPLGHATHYTYDGAENEISQTDPEGNVTTKEYDAANELIAIRYSDGKTPNVTGIEYDKDGQRTAMTDGSGKWSWTWDSLHRLTGVTEGNSGTVGYLYDLRNLPTLIAYPGGKFVARTYDSAGRLKTVTDWLGNTTKFSYDRDSDLTKETLPKASHIKDAFTFDDADRLSKILDKDETKTLFSATYGRDANGQLQSDTSAPTNEGGYGYTTLNQLCYAGKTSGQPCSSPPADASPFVYEAADNPTRHEQTTQSFNAADELCWTISPASSSHECTSPPSGATTYAYDLRGNRTSVTPASEPATSLGFDQEDRLSTYTRGTTAATYTYDGNGLRMSKTVNGATSSFVWDVGQGVPTVLSDGANLYIYGPGGAPLEQISGSTALWLHHDQLGSTRLLTNAAGEDVGADTFTPYGKVAASSGTASTPFLFAGQYRDSESGLYYLRARYYDPATGQFISRDPAAATTRAPYSYASNNSINTADPSGLAADNTVGAAPSPPSDAGPYCGYTQPENSAVPGTGQPTMVVNGVELEQIAPGSNAYIVIGPAPGFKWQPVDTFFGLNPLATRQEYGVSSGEMLSHGTDGYWHDVKGGGIVIPSADPSGLNNTIDGDLPPPSDNSSFGGNVLNFLSGVW
jgi:RHS repeat-associated protein